MMLAPKDESLYIEVICVKDVRELDDVWGSLVINEGDIRIALKDPNIFERLNLNKLEYEMG